jgi:tetratricopeptide (TPR) repeat protein
VPSVGVWVLLACAAPNALLSSAHADQARTIESPPSDRAPPEALAHYERGRASFRAGHYREAIVELRAALELDPTSANLLYNVAYTSELLGETRDAIDYYRRYLVALPENQKEERDKVLVTLRRLEGRMSEHLRAAASPQPAPQAPTTSQGFGRADVWFWSSLGGGVALLAAGTITGVIALQDEHELKTFVAGRDGTLARRTSLINQTHALALSSDIMTGAGAALVVTAALLFVLRQPAERTEQDTAPRAFLSTDGRSALLTLAGRF